MHMKRIFSLLLAAALLCALAAPALAVRIGSRKKTDPRRRAADFEPFRILRSGQRDVCGLVPAASFHLRQGVL